MIRPQYPYGLIKPRTKMTVSRTQLITFGSVRRLCSYLGQGLLDPAVDFLFGIAAVEHLLAHRCEKLVELCQPSRVAIRPWSKRRHRGRCRETQFVALAGDAEHGVRADAEGAAELDRDGDLAATERANEAGLGRVWPGFGVGLGHGGLLRRDGIYRNCISVSALSI